MFQAEGTRQALAQCVGGTAMLYCQGGVRKVEGGDNKKEGKGTGQV